MSKDQPSSSGCPEVLKCFICEIPKVCQYLKAWHGAGGAPAKAGLAQMGAQELRAGFCLHLMNLRAPLLQVGSEIREQVAFLRVSKQTCNFSEER